MCASGNELVLPIYMSRVLRSARFTAQQQQQQQEQQQEQTPHLGYVALVRQELEVHTPTYGCDQQKRTQRMLVRTEATDSARTGETGPL